MTLLSFKELQKFLKQYKRHIKAPIGDFGGADDLGSVCYLTGKLECYNVDKKTGYNLMEPLSQKFATGVCMDLLEHVKNPFVVAQNIQDSLLPGAYLFVTVPFAWEYHEHPSDFWRFTHMGLVELFADMEMIGVRQMKDKDDNKNFKRYRIVGVFRKR